MHTVTSEIDVHLPVQTVYDQWSQFEDFPKFMSGVEEVRQIDDTHTYWRVHVGGVERDFRAEIVEQKPGERVAWRSIRGPQHAGVVTFHHLGENLTRVRLQLEWDPEGFLENIGAAFQIDDARVAADLKEFARLLESNGFATGSWRGTVEESSTPTIS